MSDSKVLTVRYIMPHQTLSFKYGVQTGKSSSSIFGYQNRFRVFIVPSCDFFYHLLRLIQWQTIALFLKVLNVKF